MSTTLPHDSYGRKTTRFRLSTGNYIELTPQEERMLKIAYDYLAGFAKRSQKEAAYEKKRETVATLFANLPSSARVVVRDKAIPKLKGPGESLLVGEEVSETDRKLDEYVRAKTELSALEDELKSYSSTDHKITMKDLDAALKKFGAHLTKKELEHMIWEVDENNDEVIDYDEFQLTYYRNISDTTGNEPCSFFHVLEFLTFDEQHKGYMIEDDCMEILFARHGSSKLEEEMQWLFGANLRVAGGDGTLTLQSFMESCLRRTGRRALVTGHSGH